MQLQEPASGRKPVCPLCRGRETSLCGDTACGPVYLCSPCCEAFYLEDAPPAPTNGWLLLGYAVAALGVLALVVPAAEYFGRPAARPEVRPERAPAVRRTTPLPAEPALPPAGRMDDRRW